jgi:uncharacterized damage-inducible protein DinB
MSHSAGESSYQVCVQDCLAEMLQQVLNHSSYRRGQVALLLRQLGQTPPATDFLVFLDEKRVAL